MEGNVSLFLSALSTSRVLRWPVVQLLTSLTLRQSLFLYPSPICLPHDCQQISYQILPPEANSLSLVQHLQAFQCYVNTKLIIKPVPPTMVRIEPLKIHHVIFLFGASNAHVDSRHLAVPFPSIKGCHLLVGNGWRLVMLNLLRNTL